MKWKVRVITAPERIAMKSISNNNVGGKMHQEKEYIQEDIWKTTKSHDLEPEGKGENIDGKVQEKRCQTEMDFSFVHANAMVVRPVAGPLMLINTK
ncbi:MAG: hypothetical protein Q7U74_11070 [Saprospiraceae bacterium]|nr:hypothetical protein [Saprospiraceae bacterium]